MIIATSPVLPTAQTTFVLDNFTVTWQVKDAQVLCPDATVLAYGGSSLSTQIVKLGDPAKLL